MTDSAPPTNAAAPPAGATIGFLGPEGTFTEQALLTQADLGTADLRSLSSISEVLGATSSGQIDLGFVPIENAIEGSVNVTIDTLAFEAELLVQREVVMSIALNLLALPGSTIDGIERVLSMPMATAQCRRYLGEHLPDVEIEATNSTADAARIVGERGDPTGAAISPRLAGELHGLVALAEDVEDHPENQTRFVVVGPKGVPGPTGHDKTMVVVFQRADRPGNLLTILQEFAARSINLTKLESRPTKKGLGDYCFVIDLEGHVTDELVADSLRAIRSKQEDVKFLGSFPAAGAHGPAARKEAERSWQEAAAWIDELRSQVDG